MLTEQEEFEKYSGDDGLLDFYRDECGLTVYNRAIPDFQIPTHGDLVNNIIDLTYHLSQVYSQLPLKQPIVSQAECVSKRSFKNTLAGAKLYYSLRGRHRPYRHGDRRSGQEPWLLRSHRQDPQGQKHLRRDP